MAEKLQAKFLNTNMLDRQLWILARAMIVVYIHYDNDRCFLTCEVKSNKLDTVNVLQCTPPEYGLNKTPRGASLIALVH